MEKEGKVYGGFLGWPVPSCSHRRAPTLQVDILLAWERCGVRCPSTWVACFFPSTPLPDELQCSFHHHHTLHRHSTTLQDLIPDPALLMPDFYPNDIAWLCVDVRAEFVSLGACAVY